MVAATTDDAKPPVTLDPFKAKEILIARASKAHTKQPFALTKFAVNHEKVVVDGQARDVVYVVGIIPMDCIDDVTRAHVYNPRHPKEEHRNRLMHQIGTYGLIQPLVGTFDKATKDAHKIFLIDGRHRFHALLGLDDKLRADIVARSKEAKAKRDIDALSDISNLKPPPEDAISSLNTYEPTWDAVEDGQGSPMVPVKIYLDQDEVERIGMAVFLNKGQKKLAGGEEIDRIYDALALAIEDEKDTSETPSEKRAVDRVMKGRGTNDPGLVVLSRHVAMAMRVPESPWHYVIGRWQSDALEEDDEVIRKKPLTAKNYLAFVSQLVDATPMEGLDDALREAEVDNLDKLGNLFSKIFDWPDDIPTPDKRHTPTSIICRSFFVTALGKVLNDRRPSGSPAKVFSQRRVAKAVWTSMAKDLTALQKELVKQAKLREKFDERKKALKAKKTASPEERQPLLVEIDQLRGELWSMDTIVSSLESRMIKVLA